MTLFNEETREALSRLPSIDRAQERVTSLRPPEDEIWDRHLVSLKILDVIHQMDAGEMQDELIRIFWQVGRKIHNV